MDLQVENGQSGNFEETSKHLKIGDKVRQAYEHKMFVNNSKA